MRVVPLPLKKALLCPLLWKSSLGSAILGNFHPLFNLYFLGKVTEKVVEGKFQRYLDEVGYLDPFQLGWNGMKWKWHWLQF